MCLYMYKQTPHSKYMYVTLHTLHYTHTHNTTHTHYTIHTHTHTPLTALDVFLTHHNWLIFEAMLM